MNKTLKRNLLLISTLLANTFYLLWRIFFTMPTERTFLSLFFAIGLLFAEFLGIFELFVYLYGATNAVTPSLPTVSTEHFPDVDVFIATYNEPVSLLRKTIVACKNMNYPTSKCVTIFLCDDGNRDEMHTLAKELGVQYLCRESNHGAKAGNLNNALRQSHAPLIATFDADMIPMKNFLLNTVPYFLDESENIGFIQTPQCFYNADLFQAKLHSSSRIPNEQDYFYRNVQLTKNRTNTVIYGGSNTVISRKALEEVGGFYEDSITEDFATGILIQSKGYRCYAISTPLASGLAPNDLKSLMKQRERWARGCIQTIKQLNIYGLKGLSLTQKISYTSAISYWYAPIKRFFYIMSPIAFTVFGIQVIRASLIEIILFFIPTYLLTNAAVRGFCNHIRNARWTNIYETITSPTLIKCVLLETFGFSENNFSVTNKSSHVDYDQSYHYERARPFFFYIICSLIGIMNIFIYMPGYTTLNYLILLFWLITNLLYIIIALFFILEFHQTNTDIHYKEKLKFHLKNDKGSYHAITSEISDTYLRFTTNHPLDIEDGDSFHVRFDNPNAETSNYCEFEISISNIDFAEKCNDVLTPPNKETQYFAYITDINVKHRDLWNLILHNRIPTMPKTIHGSKNIFQDLGINISARIKRSVRNR